MTPPMGQAWPKTVKQPATASKGMVTSNHPLASLAGTEMLVRGGNAVDAAIATMFALSVVEPMMVTIFGAGFVNIRLADGTCTVIDNYVTVPGKATPDMFDPVPNTIEHKVVGELNEVGHLAVAVGGTLKGWSAAIEKYGRLSLAEVVEPAVRFARLGFAVSPYLHSITRMQEANIRRFRPPPRSSFPAANCRTSATALSARITRHAGGHRQTWPGLPVSRSARPGDRRRHGGQRRHHHDGRHRELPGVRAPARPRHVSRWLRDHRPAAAIVRPAPHHPDAEHLRRHFDIAGLGFGTPDSVHTWAEAMKIAFADRFKYVADPASTDVPVDWLTSEGLRGRACRATSMSRRRSSSRPARSASMVESTTHCMAIDRWGNIVATTNTLHMAFGSKVTVPGTGMLLNDCMELMDPVPGHTNSIAPGKRVLSSMSPVIVRQGRRALP